MRSAALLVASAALATADSPVAKHLGWRKGGALYTPQGAPTPKYAHPYTAYQNMPTPTANANVPAPNPAFQSACASVSSMVASQTSANPKSSATPTVPAQLAYECLSSVPFNQSAALALLDSMVPYLQWQTTIEYLQNPPQLYREKVQAPYNFWQYWENIVNNAKLHNYENEYEFGFQLYRLFQQAHDGHFVFIPDSVGLIFNFARTTPLVSVSMDGKSVPEVYAYSDILENAFGNATFTPSPLTQIDGQDATDYLLTWSQYGSLQDRDALWNNMFYDLAQVSLGPSGTGMGTFVGGGRGRWVYPGPATTLTFKNGTSVTTANYAKVLVDFDDVHSGEDLYMEYFVPPNGDIQDAQQLATVVSSSSAPAATATATATAIPAPGYPAPFIRSPGNINSGYFLEGEGYDDVAVLAVPSFVSGTETDEKDFQITNTYFLNQAVAMGKKKLIIDVSANGGGTILQGYDLFKQLFPEILPYGANRFRAHEALDLIGAEVSYYGGLVPRSLQDNETVQNILSTSWNYRTDDNVDYQPFTSWDQKFGPTTAGPLADNFTTTQRWNLSDVLTPDNSGGIYISGYGPRSNITKQPFAPEDIVIVYDGYCASTCTIFSELMTAQGGVKTIALGGRPNTDVIQAVGGVKGTNDLPYSYLLYSAELPFEIQHYHNASYYQNQTILGNYTDLPMYRSIDSVVNARDGLMAGDGTETPLQFIYQPADCRIFYTPEMAIDETAVWKTVADTAFNGKSSCVAGSLNENSKRSEKEASKHTVRHDLNLAEHYRALGGVFTGTKGDVALGGDCFMSP